MTWRSQDASSQYDSLQAKFEQRLTSGVWFLASYTWSRAFGWAENPGIGGDYAWEKAPLSFDVPQNLALSYGLDLPFGKGKHFLSTAGRLTDNILGGWQLTGTVIFRSGLAYIARGFARCRQHGSWRPKT